jgi:hypothetical protein
MPIAAPLAMPLGGIPATTTLLGLRTAVRQRADQENSLFCSDGEVNSYINQSYFELYDLLIQKYGNDYFIAPDYTFTTDGTSDKYALPTDFYKILGVDLLLSGGNSYSLTVRPFQMAERNRWAWPNMQALYGLVNLRYRLNGSYIWFVPRPAAGQTIRLLYVPRLNVLQYDSDEIDGVSGWDEYIVVDAAIKCMQKEESDVSVLMAQKQALIRRIEAAAENRDAGSPQKVSDSRGSDYEWPPGASGYGWGGGF